MSNYVLPDARVRYPLLTPSRAILNTVNRNYSKLEKLYKDRRKSGTKSYLIYNNKRSMPFKR